LIHLRLNALVVISWVILLKIVGIGRKNPRKGKHHASTAEDDESKRKQKSPSNEKETNK
jgi:hypothetical protein